MRLLQVGENKVSEARTEATVMLEMASALPISKEPKLGRGLFRDGHCGFVVGVPVSRDGLYESYRDMEGRRPERPKET